MRSIDGVSEVDYRQIRLLATALGISDGEAVGFLLRRLGELAGDPRPGVTVIPSTTIDIHAVYDGQRTEATYDPDTGAVTITSGRLAGRRFRSPSGAAIAVVQESNPRIHPNRNGWTFWTDTATGHQLQSIRRPAKA